jgi:hypothetical protein
VTATRETPPNPDDRSRAPAALIHYAGPDELAGALVSYRGANKGLFQGAEDPPILDADIQRLVQLVYHASLVPDEGRYAHFRVVSTGTSTVAGVQLAASVGGIPLDRSLETLKRLVPAMDDPGAALLVHSGPDSRLMAWSIVDFSHFCDENSGKGADRLWDAPTLPGGMLFLRATGPGDIRAMLHPGPVMHLRAGTIKQLRGYTKAVAPFNVLLARLGADAHAAFHSDPRAARFLPTPFEYAMVLARLWSATLSVALRDRHGGCFAILDAPHDQGLDIRFPANAHLYGSLVEALRHCFDPLAAHAAGEHGDVRDRWRNKELHLLALARLIGRLAATDGCVVLDQRLSVVGFGAKIAVPEQPGGPPLLDAASGTPVPDEDVGGMRHRSAVALVRARPGAIAFVVSQDGDLTAFFSDERAAYRAAHLHAASSVSEFI